jgi:hypothetical protein
MPPHIYQPLEQYKDSSHLLACISIFLFIGVIFKVMSENAIDRLRRKMRKKKKLSKEKKNKLKKRKKNKLGT